MRYLLVRTTLYRQLTLVRIYLLVEWKEGPVGFPISTKPERIYDIDYT